jgi:hypothetical protein
MSNITFGYVVNRVRELTDIFSDQEVKYRDGFAADAITTGLTPILPSVLEYLASKAWCKYGFENFTYTSSAGVYDIDIDAQSWVGFYDIEEVSIAGVPLLSTTRESLSNRSINWRAQSNGTPTEYFREGSRLVFNRPFTAGIVVTVRSSASQPVITTSADKVKYMPDAMALRVPFGAAANMVTVDAENPVHVNRIEHYRNQDMELTKELLEYGEAQTQEDDASRMSMDNYVGQVAIATGGR